MIISIIASIKAIIMGIFINVVGIISVNLGKRIMIIKIAKDNRKATTSGGTSDLILRYILSSLVMGLSNLSSATPSK
jgi:hypothetical protein